MFLEKEKIWKLKEKKLKMSDLEVCRDPFLRFQPKVDHGFLWFIYMITLKIRVILSLYLSREFRVG
jgi:hypothetical protein